MAAGGLFLLVYSDQLTTQVPRLGIHGAIYRTLLYELIVRPERISSLISVFYLTRH
jgi:hypothetical protein